MKLSILALAALSTLAALPAATIATTPAQAGGCYSTVAPCPIVLIPDIPDLPFDPHFPPNHDTPDTLPWEMIACLAVGEDGTDLKIRNIGDLVIREGQHVVWKVALTGEVGDFYMPRDLLPGADLTQADMLDLAVPPKTHCLSRLA